MARITIDLSTSNPGDIEMLNRLFGSASPRAMTAEDAIFHGALDRRIRMTPEEVGAAEDAMADQPKASATEDAEPGERKRFKRTNEEIARGLTVEQAKAERLLAQQGSDLETSETVATVEATSEPSPEVAADEDPFADPASLDTSSESPASVTLAELKERLKAYLGNHDASDAKKVLAAYGVGNLGALDAKHYGAVYAALEV